MSGQGSSVGVGLLLLPVCLVLFMERCYQTEGLKESWFSRHESSSLLSCSSPRCSKGKGHGRKAGMAGMVPVLSSPFHPPPQNMVINVYPPPKATRFRIRKAGKGNSIKAQMNSGGSQMQKACKGITEEGRCVGARGQGHTT